MASDGRATRSEERRMSALSSRQGRRIQRKGHGARGEQAKKAQLSTETRRPNTKRHGKEEEEKEEEEGGRRRH